MRKEFELSRKDLDIILDASEPTPVMFLSGGQLVSGPPQKNANRAWEKIGKKYGFVWDTASLLLVKLNDL